MSSLNNTLKGGDNGRVRAKHPRLDFTRLDEEVAAVLRKFVDDPRGSSRDAQGRKMVRMPSDELMQTISSRTANSINDANSMLQLLPDVELARQILVSSILSPNDLTKVDLHFKLEEGYFDGEIAGGLIDVIDEYFDRVYKIKKILPNILSEALFTKGSYPLLIVPENTLDDIINSPERVSMESLRSELHDDGTPIGLGILGDPNSKDKDQKISLESLSRVGHTRTGGTYSIDGLMLSITDNPSVLKLPMVIDKMTQDRIQDIYSLRNIGMEARRTKFDDSQLESTLYRRRQYSYVPVLPVTPIVDGKRDSTGHPLVFKLPPESVIPVHVPSNPEEHVGYFVMLDNLGNPVSKALESDYYNELQSNLRKNKEIQNQLLDRVMGASYGTDFRATPREIEEMTRSYADLVETSLINSLRNGVYGDSVEISRPYEIYRIMLARAAAGMQTRLLYVPTDLMTYIAFDFNSYGIGRSLLESSKILGSIRAVLMFASTMAMIKNSVGRTSLRVTLDPQDPDPTRTVEFLVHEYARTSRAGYPLGESNPADIIDYLQKASIDLQVEGHPGYPETKIDVEDKSSGRILVDTELEENMKRRHIMAMGLAPEMVDLTTGVDFATSVVTSNLLLTKRVMVYQDKLTHYLAEFVRKYTLHSGKLMEKLREVVESKRHKLSDEHKDLDTDAVIRLFLEALEVGLPSPDSSTLETQMTAYNQYSEALDTVLDAYFSSEFLDGSVLGDVADSVDSTRAALKAYYQRQWLRNNNVLPELNDLTTFDEKGGPAFNLLEAHDEHIQAIAKSLESFMQKALKAIAKREKRQQEFLDKLDAENQESDEMGEEETAYGETDGVAEEEEIEGEPGAEEEEIEAGEEEVEEEEEAQE